MGNASLLRMIPAENTTSATAGFDSRKEFQMWNKAVAIEIRKALDRGDMAWANFLRGMLI
jgi:hypothetical protein